MKRCLPLIVCVLVPSCCWSDHGHPSHWVEKTANLEFDPAAVESLRVETHNGSIRTAVDPARERIQVVADVRGGGEDALDAQAALDAIELVSEVKSGELVLGWRWLAKRPGWGADVAFDVVLPGELPTRAETHNGDVEITARGECAVVTHNGSVRIAGEVEHVMAISHNGAVTVVGPVRQVDATTHNGGVRVVDTAGGPLTGRIVTHNGSVSVELAPATGTALDCSTSSGAIAFTGPLRDVSRGDDHLVGRLGAADGRLSVRTHNGNITIRAEDDPPPR